MKNGELKQDMAVLLHARAFGITTYDPSERSGGTVMGALGAVSEARQKASVRRLVAAGLMEPKGDCYKSLKRKAQPYQITAAGRVRLREYHQTPELTVDVARGMHSGDLANVYGDLPLAQRQLELRRQANGTVRAALKALGHEYTGSGGWHITAYATPENRLGFVNIAHGIAIETDVEFEEEGVVALTVPDQGEGCKASGAAAWTAPDAGEGSRASVPDGWMQLLVDVRTGAGESVDIQLDRVSARVVMWGLQTCYSRPGEPGNTTLDGKWSAHERLPISEWPADDLTRCRMHAIGARWLDSVARKMADLAGCGEGVSAALDSKRTEEPVYADRGPGEPILPDVDISGAIRATGVYGSGSFGYNAKAAAESCCNSVRDVTRNALRECHVGRISAACDISNVVGLRYYDLITYCLQRAIVQRLEPVAEALWASMAPLVGGREDGWSVYMRIVPVLERLAAELASDLLRGVAEEANATEAAMVEAYYAHGPVVVDFPVGSAA